jgi:hypothetical protein
MSENVFRSETRMVPGVGQVTIETIDFPTFYLHDGSEDFPFSGFESVLTLPDGEQVGHGPDDDGETPEMLHASWPDELIREIVRKRLEPKPSTNMFVLEDKEVTDLLVALENRGDQLEKLRISVRGDHIAWKVNEGGWSPPTGRVQEPY